MKIGTEEKEENRVNRKILEMKRLCETKMFLK